MLLLQLYLALLRRRILEHMMRMTVIDVNGLVKHRWIGTELKGRTRADNMSLLIRLELCIIKLNLISSVGAEDSLMTTNEWLGLCNILVHPRMQR